MKKYGLLQSKMIAENIKKYRLVQDMKVDYICNRLSISRSLYYKIISGKEEIDANRVPDFAAVLEVETKDLLGEVEEIRAVEIDEINLLEEKYHKSIIVIRTYLKLLHKDELKKEIDMIMTLLLQTALEA